MCKKEFNTDESDKNEFSTDENDKNQFKPYHNIRDQLLRSRGIEELPIVFVI